MSVRRGKLGSGGAEARPQGARRTGVEAGRAGTGANGGQQSPGRAEQRGVHGQEERHPSSLPA